MISDRDLAISIWEYNKLHHTIQPADFIFVMCSYNLIVADRAADLFHDEVAPFIIVSGGIAHVGDLIETGWDQTEAFMFKQRLVELNVPEEKIISENRATNCGENIQFSRALLAERNIPVEQVLLFKSHIWSAGPMRRPANSGLRCLGRSHPRKFLMKVIYKTKMRSVLSILWLEIPFVLLIMLKKGFKLSKKCLKLLKIL